MSALDIFRSRAVLERRTGARAAPTELYSTSGPYNIVPRLDLGRKKQKTATQQFPANPLITGPTAHLAMRIGALPIKVYTIDPATSRKAETKTHPGYTILRTPNPAMTRSLFISGTVLHLLLHQKAAWLKVRSAPQGPPEELWPLMAQALRVEIDPKNLVKRFVLTVDGRPRYFDPRDVCYFRLLPDPDNWADGISSVASLGPVGTFGDSAINSGTDMFDRALLGRQWIQATREISTRAFNRLKAQMEQARADRYAIPILEDGFEMHDQAGPDAKVIVDAITTANSVIKDALGIPEDGDEKKFTKQAVQPICDAIEQELERTLFSEWPDQPAFPQFAFRDELRGDPLQRFQMHQTAILSGQETPNEARLAEDREPLDGGDELMVPLNLVPVSAVADDGVPREKDTAGGLGGDEGKGTVPSAQARMRAPAVNNWGKKRRRVLEGQSNAAARRLKSVVNGERKKVLDLFKEGRAAATEVRMPTIAEIRDLVGGSDAAVRQVLEQFMAQTRDATSDDAAELIAAAEAAVSDRLEAVFAERSGVVSSRFAQVRTERIQNILGEAFANDVSMRDVARRIADAYGDLATGFVDGIARTEIAWAHEQTALMVWADSGISEMDVVFGGGSCTTGVCEDVAAAGPYQLGERVGNVGYSFEGADAPPMHPNCTCFAVPSIDVDVAPERTKAPRPPAPELDGRAIAESIAEGLRSVLTPLVRAATGQPDAEVVAEESPKRSFLVVRNKQGQIIRIEETTEED